MSPQLHKDIYGVFPHSFRQQMREGGFRPVVFLGHGLYVAMFFAVSFLSLAFLIKGKSQSVLLWFRGHKKWMALFLILTLVLCKTWSALIYAVLGLAAVLLSKVKLQVYAAVFISFLVLSYPLVRGSSAINYEGVIELVKSYNPGRAASLEFRFNNEEILLEKANERSIFGWGAWGRGRVYDATGRDISVTDGVWIIVFGIGGYFGYLAFFGLLCTPLILLFLSMRKNKDMNCVNIYTSGLGLILAFNLLDLIPNSSLSILTLLIAGAISGAVLKQPDGKSQGMVQ